MGWTEQQRSEVAAQYAEQRIFVAIAAVDEARVVAMVQHALNSAAAPSRLRFGICVRSDGVGDDFADDPRVTVDRVPSASIPGPGRAALHARAHRLYDAERYLLQLSGPVRFEPAWDEWLISMLRATQRPRPIVTGWSPASDRSARPPLVDPGNLFTLGRFVVDVPVDPEIADADEARALSIRAYTHGYDGFWPTRAVVPPDDDGEVEPARHDGVEDRVALLASRRKADRLARGDDRGMGPYGLGRLRSVTARPG